jgi:hypothetical protein
VEGRHELTCSSLDDELRVLFELPNLVGWIVTEPI